MKNKKNRASQKPTHKPMHSRTETPKPGESATKAAAEPFLSIAAAPNSARSDTAESDTGEPLLAEVQSFLAKRTELAKRLKEEIAATELRLDQLRKTAASLMAERSAPAGKEKKPKKTRPAAKEGATPTAPDESNASAEAGPNVGE